MGVWRACFSRLEAFPISPRSWVTCRSAILIADAADPLDKESISAEVELEVEQIGVLRNLVVATA